MRSTEKPHPQTTAFRNVAPSFALNAVSTSYMITL